MKKIGWPDDINLHSPSSLRETFRLFSKAVFRARILQRLLAYKMMDTEYVIHHFSLEGLDPFGGE